METKIAKFIKNLGNPGNAPHHVEQHLYQVSPPMVGGRWRDDEQLEYEYVVVSAADLSSYYSGPETYIFGSNADGDIDNFSELDGSFQGGLDHEQALRNAGYEVFPGDVIEGEYTVNAPLEITAGES